MSVLNLICVLTSFLAPGVPDAFYFNEANVTLFLDHFKLLDKNYYVSNSEDSSTLNFKELYTAVMKKARCTEFKHSLMKAMRESALRKLNHQKKLLMKIDAVIICADDMLLSLPTAESVKKLKSKTVLN